jgi:ABC-type nitrate/sulfonate/bicarbonate transport system substrate-binding protein
MRRVLAIVVGLALVAAGCGDDGGDEEGSSGADAGGEPLEITVGHIPPFTAFTWPFIIANAEGWFAEEGITVDPVYGFDGAPLLAGGQIDVLGHTAGEGLVAAQQGTDAIAFGPLSGHVTDGLLVTPDITDIADLEGTTLRTSNANATDEFVLERLLEENGVDLGSVSFLPVEDDGAALAQLAAGQIDGGMFDQGILNQANNGEIEGAAVLVEPPDFGSYPWGAWQTTRTFAEAHPDEMAGFMRAILRAVEFIRDPANEDAVIAAVVAEDESLDEEGVANTYEAARSFGDFSLYATEALTVEDIEPAVAYLENNLGEEITIDLADFIDNTYFEQAQAEG